jgi:hypothetical protein
MKRILFLFGLLLVSVLSMAQAPSNYTNINGRYRWIAGMFDSTFHIPKGTTPSLRTGGSTNAGALFYNTTDSSVYTYTGTQWIKLRGVVIDTTSLSNRINLKLNISDTSSMLTNYFRINGVGLNRAGQTVLADTLLLSTRAWRQKGIDSVASLITSGYVPYTGATTNVNLGTHSLTAYNLIINHSSGSGVAASITKGGNGEALTISKTSGSGNAMSVSGGLTSLVDLSLSSVANATTDTDRFLVSDGGVVKYRTGAEVLSDIGAAASTSISGTTNYIPKFTSSSAIGNSIVQEGTNSIGIGITPSSWGSTFRALQINPRVVLFSSTGSNDVVLGNNYYNNGTSNLYLNTDFASAYLQASGNHVWYNAPSGTAGNSVSFSEQMRLTSTGLGIGTSSPASKLSVGGDGYSGRAITAISNATAYAVTIRQDATNGSGLQIFHNTTSWGNGTPLVIATSSADLMRLDASGNLGLGVTPSAWGSGYKAFELTQGGLSGNGLTGITLRSNNYFDGTNAIYKSSFAAGLYNIGNSVHSWHIAPVGTAGNAISFTQAMTLDASGNLGLGTTVTTAISGGYTGFFMNGSSGSNIDFRAGGTGYGRVQADVNGLLFAGLNSVPITFFTGGSERMRITSGGNVGIGSTSPNIGVWNRALTLNTASGNAAYELAVGGSAQLYLAVDNSNAYLQVANATSPLRVFTGGSERMRITSGGNVGIGTTAPSSKVQINDSNSDLISAFGNLSIFTTNSQAANNGGTIGFGGVFQNSDIAQWAGIKGGKENSTSGDYGGYLSFFTRPNGGSNTERMRITSGGELLISTSTDAGDYKLQVNGNAYILGSLSTKSSTTASTYTMAASDFTMGFDCTSGSVTANLPDAVANAGKIYVIYQYNTGTATRGVTIDGNGAQTINGSATYVLTGYCDYSSVMIQSDGNNWVVISDALQTGCL